MGIAKIIIRRLFIVFGVQCDSVVKMNSMRHFHITERGGLQFAIIGKHIKALRIGQFLIDMRKDSVFIEWIMRMDITRRIVCGSQEHFIPLYT